MKIKLSELRELVKSIIQEQAAPVAPAMPAGKTYSSPKRDLIFKTSSGKLFTDKSNFKDEGLFSITKEEPAKNGIVKIYYVESDNPFFFSCKYNAFNHNINGFNNTVSNFYNTSYSNYLKSTYCK